MFDFVYGKETQKINQLIKEDAKSRLSDIEFIENEIRRFKYSQRRMDMIAGERYFIGRHDISSRKRTMIGENGELEEVKNLPNNRIIDNQYKKMVNQKVNYLLGQPISAITDNVQYSKALKMILNKRFLRLIKNVGRDTLNCGIGWLLLYYGESGELLFKRLKPYEVIPEWKDDEHTQLECVIRIYEVISYNGKQEQIIERVEVYDSTGIRHFICDNGKLVIDKPAHEAYFTVVDDKGAERPHNWSRMPIIPFKYNSEEISLLKGVKSLQDGLNLILSNFQNNMEEDSRNTILVLVNYDGQNLGEFRKNLSTYGAVKVKTIDGSAGDLKTLQVEVNAENYKSILEIFKKAIIENAMGYDAKDDRLAGNPNQMNIQSMYSDIDLDANEMETEYQASFEELLWFINAHLYNVGIGDFGQESVDIIFNRDMMISESEVLDNCQKSIGILSDETIVAQHPWVDDPQKELDRLKQQRQEEQAKEESQSYNPFVSPPKDGDITNEK